MISLVATRAQQKVWVLLALVAVCGVTIPWLNHLLFNRIHLAIVISSAIVVLVCAAAILFWPAYGSERASRWEPARPPRASIIFLVATPILWLIGGGVLLGLAISDDQYAAILQAKTFALGQLSVPAPPVPSAFAHANFVVVGDRWISKYPPGWALLLTPFAALNWPTWLLPGLFGAGSVSLFWHLARERLGQKAAALASLSFAGCAFFALNAATVFSHIPATFFGLAAVAAYGRAQQTRDRRFLMLMLAGLSLGAMGLIRPFNGAIFVGVFAGALIIRKGAWREKLADLAAFGAGGAPFACILLAYQWAVTGSPLTTIPAWMGNPEPVGEVSASSAYYLVRRLLELCLFTSPVLVLAAALAPLKLLQTRAFNLSDALFPATLLAFLFYGGDGGLGYGPRYLFEAYPYLVLSAAAALPKIAPSPRTAVAAVVVHLTFQLAALPSWLALQGWGAYTAMTPYRRVAEAHLSNAIVILRTGSTGVQKMRADDLARNGLDVRAPSVIYAIDIGDGGKALRSAFPQRKLWIYDDGALTPLSEAAATSGEPQSMTTSQ